MVMQCRPAETCGIVAILQGSKKGFGLDCEKYDDN